MPRQRILGTAGHIDHGKTALVRALTGVDTDRLPQEKRRGITIDLGFARLDVGGVTLGIVDVPGHERFIKNMLAGASGIDVALLVVAADDAVMPQTREHLAILQLLGIRRGVVAITKTDLVDGAWLDLVEQEVRGLVGGTFLAGAPIVRTSARSGTGLDELREALAAAAVSGEDATVEAPFRLGVDRSFVAEGLGTVVTGTVRSGTVRTGEEVELLPAGRRVRVRGIQSHDVSIEEARRGRRAALNLAGVHHTEVSRGDELSTPGLLRPATRLGVRVRVLEDSPWALRHRARVRLHLGTGEVIASVRLLGAPTLEPGADALAEIACAEPVVAIAGQPFVVRSESPVVTIGGGAVLQAPSRVRRRDAGSVELLAAMESDDPTARASAAIASMGMVAWHEDDLWRAAGLWGEGAREAIARLVAGGEVLELAGPPPLRIHRRAFEDASARIIRALERLHEATPLEARIERSRLLQELAYLNARLVEAVVGRMARDGRLEVDASGVAIAGRGPALSPTQRRVREAWLAGCRARPFSPPGPAEIARAAGVSEEEARRVAGVCVRLGELVRIGEDLHMDGAAIDELVTRLRSALEAREGLTVSEIKGLLGTSRKFAVPICEHLDRMGVTARRGDVRVLARA